MISIEKKYILDQDVVEKKMRRMALEIIENNHDEPEIILAGIRENGTVVAKNIQQLITELSSVKIQLLTISLDKRHPDEIVLNHPVDFTDKIIIIIDDVASSGKTLMYSLKPFLEFHPKKIQSLVLVERSHKAFPVHADYVGLSIATTLQEHIYVEVVDDKIMGAYMK